MKLQLSFETPDLNKALDIAEQTQEFADVFEIGSLLLAHHGIEAVKQFRAHFPEMTLLADIKVVDRPKAFVEACIKAGANWITVLSGTSKSVIHRACSTAHDNNAKIMLDLIDASSLGQSALEAKSLGVNALLFHKPIDQANELAFLDDWDMVAGNTELPVYVSARITRQTIQDVFRVSPSGIVLSDAILEADNPREEAAFFSHIIHR